MKNLIGKEFTTTMELRDMIRDITGITTTVYGLYYGNADYACYDDDNNKIVSIIVDDLNKDTQTIVEVF